MERETGPDAHAAPAPPLEGLVEEVNEAREGEAWGTKALLAALGFEWIVQPLRRQFFQHFCRNSWSAVFGFPTYPSLAPPLPSVAQHLAPSAPASPAAAVDPVLASPLAAVAVPREPILHRAATAPSADVFHCVAAQLYRHAPEALLVVTRAIAEAFDDDGRGLPPASMPSAGDADSPSRPPSPSAVSRLTRAPLPPSSAYQRSPSQLDAVHAKFDPDAASTATAPAAAPSPSSPLYTSSVGSSDAEAAPQAPPLPPASLRLLHSLPSSPAFLALLAQTHAYLHLRSELDLTLARCPVPLAWARRPYHTELPPVGETSALVMKQHDLFVQRRAKFTAWVAKNALADASAISGRGLAPPPLSAPSASPSSTPGSPTLAATSASASASASVLSGPPGESALLAQWSRTVEGVRARDAIERSTRKHRHCSYSR
jgi:hypothetical protein